MAAKSMPMPDRSRSSDRRWNLHREGMAVHALAFAAVNVGRKWAAANVLFDDQFPAHFFFLLPQALAQRIGAGPKP